ncbi:DUF1003 domain-containing protein [Candidatus Woesearchaeota archaeon]|nr:DUF1003 domain-containing protein [Candidatus Woesearchaeota archaeon]
MLQEENHNANLKKSDHPLFFQRLTPSQKAADTIAHFGGSWTFIIIFFLFFVTWIILNTWLLLTQKVFDPYPYILLNLTLSCLAAIQAPIILMTQNRQAERDRINARYDYAINRKAEREIQTLQRDVDEIKKMMRKR